MIHNPFNYLIEYCKIKFYIKKCQNLPPYSFLLPQTMEQLDVSIIIPVFNQWNLTKACINSLLLSNDDTVRYELILADDCSTDETYRAQEYYPGIKIVKTPTNIGFLRNCNHAIKQAQGTYIVLLNNDTIVLPNWLNSLYKVMKEEPNTAIVGSKILNKTGTIQEAGRILFQNGISRSIGEGKHRRTPAFNIPREVDYTSGCSIMIRKTFWEAVNGFDTRYLDAYYEDVDLALMAKALKMHVRYQPESELVHFLSKSYLSKKKSLGKKFARENHLAFITKWQETLKEYPRKHKAK